MIETGLGTQTGHPGPFALTDADRQRLTARLRAAVKRARRSGAQTLATISLPLSAEVDPTQVICASRRARTA